MDRGHKTLGLVVTVISLFSYHTTISPTYCKQHALDKFVDSFLLRYPTIREILRLTAITELLPLLVHQLMHNLHCPNEFGLVLLTRPDLARSGHAPLRTTIHPLQILTKPRNALVLSVDILAPWRVLCRDDFEDAVKLVDERGCVWV
jgi:hypothetical protein